MSRPSSLREAGFSRIVVLGALALGALALCGGAALAQAPRPSVPLYAGAEPNPKLEHVFTYPLDEALGQARAMLQAHDLDVEPYGDGTGLMTRWRIVGRGQKPRAGPGGSYAGMNKMRRFYVQGQALDANHSVVRIFRVDRDEAYTGKDTPSDTAVAADHASTPQSQMENQFDEFVQRGDAQAIKSSGLPADTGRNHAKEMADLRVEDTARRGEAALGKGERGLTNDPRFATQHRGPVQDDLRGRSELGLRDREMERELVQRLEQFASLEFTGGAYDPPPPPAPSRSAPLTNAWEQEQGGLPFSSEDPLVPCGVPVLGVGKLSKPGLAVLVGEQLGTREVPAAVGNLACQIAQQRRPVILGLAMPREEQPALDAYLRSMGSREDQDVLLTGEFWRQVPRDGRSSRALVVLIERVRRMRNAGLPLELVAYDAKDLRGNAREQRAAELLLARAHARPEATLVVLGGNYHARLKDGASWSSSLQPLGSRLVRGGLEAQSLDTAFARGQRWACAVNLRREADCRVYATAPTEQSYSPEGKAPSVQLFKAPSEQGFTGLLHVGALTPALPAQLPAPAEDKLVRRPASSRAPAAAAANVAEAVAAPLASASPGPGEAPAPVAAAAPAKALPEDVVTEGEEAPAPAQGAPGAVRSPEACGQPITGADALFVPRGLLLLGEVQGSNEIPAVVGQLVCQAASRGLPVTLAVELPRREQRRLNRFLASDGGAAGQALLLQGEFWHRTYQDGRSSTAMLQLLERVRADRKAGLPIEVLAFDTFAQGTRHEVLMAQALLAERTRSPERLMMVLTGNVHARTVKGTQWDPELVPMGQLLRQREPNLVSLDVDHGGGAAYNCKLEPGGKVACAAYREVAPIDMRKRFMSGASVERHFLGHRPFVQVGPQRSPEGFDGLYYVGRLSAAPPAAPEQRAAAQPPRP